MTMDNEIEYLELLKDEEVLLKVGEHINANPNVPLDIHVEIDEDKFGKRTVKVSS